MNYRTPVREMLFVLDEIAGLAEIQTLPGFRDLSRDVVAAVLEEHGRFVEQEVAPLDRVGDTQGASWHDGAVAMPPGFARAFKAFAGGGWQGLGHDVRWGGQGLPAVVAAAASEDLNAGSLAFSLCPLLTDGVIEALSLVGTEGQRARFIPPLLQGRWTGTMNLTEPQAGSDLARIATRAVRQADGSYRITGQKIFITYGEHDLAENIVHLVLARTPDAPEGVKGISLFIVPKFLVDDRGGCGPRNDIYCASIEHKLGIHASPTAVMLYGAGKGMVGEGAVAELVGEENRGLEYMFIMMNAARFAVGVQGIAVAERALQRAQVYAAGRVQGQAPGSVGGAVSIDRHPDVQRMLATMRALTESGRALAYFAAAQADKAAHHPDAARRAECMAVYEYLVPVVKGFCTESAVEVASLGVQVHGGVGYIEETGAAQQYRDARILPIYEGTTAIQANDLLGRKTLRDEGKTARALSDRMRSTVVELQLRDAAGQGGELLHMARHLEQAVDAYDKAVGFMLAAAKHDLRAAYAGSVPYLMLTGLVVSGWLMACAALACHRIEGEGAGDAFHVRKRATAVFHAFGVLPRAQALGATIVEGGRLAAAAAGSCASQAPGDRS